MITAKQIKAARVFLDLEQRDLAERSGLSLPTIQRMEKIGVGRSSADNAARVQRALEDAGVEFIPENGGGPGVRMRHRGDAARFECSELKSGGWQVVVTIPGEVQQNVSGFDDEAEAQSWIDRGEAAAWLTKYHAGRPKRAGGLS